jgi:D-mannonate dehydratase
MAVAQATLALHEWDWRYRVGYEDTLAGKVEHVSRQLPPAEQKCLQAALTWARSFISLDRLLQGLEVGEINISIVESLPLHHLIHLPTRLRDRYIERVRRLKKSIEQEN